MNLAENALELLEAFLMLPWFVHLGVVAVFAGLMGSFINVCIWRIPRGESIVWPRSRCTSCGHILDAIDLLPIVTYLATLGHCRHCKAKVSLRYVIVEFINVGLWTTSYLLLGMTRAFLIVGATLSALLALTGITLMTRHIRSTSRSGFTFISVIMAMLILGVSVGPFLSIARTGFLGSTKNQEYIKAYALCVEKIEELRGIPARNLISDRKIYIETERSTDNIFGDEFFGDYSRMREDKKYFVEKFSDVFTEQNKYPDNVMDRFKRNFKKYYGFDYQLYPSGYEVFRRITEVTEVEDKDHPQYTTRRVTVTVEVNSKATKGRKFQMQALLSDH